MTHQLLLLIDTCFNTQPPEGGWLRDSGRLIVVDVSTHSRPKAAGELANIQTMPLQFQHTAARRRLVCEAAGGH